METLADYGTVAYFARRHLHDRHLSRVVLAGRPRRRRPARRRAARVRHRRRAARALVARRGARCQAAIACAARKRRRAPRLAGWRGCARDADLRGADRRRLRAAGVAARCDSRGPSPGCPAPRASSSSPGTAFASPADRACSRCVLRDRRRLRRAPRARRAHARRRAACSRSATRSPGRCSRSACCCRSARVDNWLAEFGEREFGVHDRAAADRHASSRWSTRISSATSRSRWNGVEPGFARITPNMDDAARSLGAGTPGTLARVHAPLLARTRGRRRAAGVRRRDEGAAGDAGAAAVQLRHAGDADVHAGAGRAPRRGRTAVARDRRGRRAAAPCARARRAPGHGGRTCGAKRCEPSPPGSS